jgi:hypothetical protein
MFLIFVFLCKKYGNPYSFGGVEEGVQATLTVWPGFLEGTGWVVSDVDNGKNIEYHILLVELKGKKWIYYFLPGTGIRVEVEMLLQ